MIARVATPAEADAVATALARAFQDDPVMSWLIPDDVARRAKLPKFFGAMLRGQHLRHELTYTTDDFAGGAAWDPPGAWKVGLWDQARLAPAMLSIFGFKIFRTLSLLTAIQPKHPDEPHYYLFAIGTDPAHQNRGVGAALMAPVLARCDAEKIPAYLESLNERNLPFYRRHGFVETDELRIGKDGPKLTLMKRPPR